MQLKNFYPKMSVLGIATVMALTACGDENTQALFANNPVPGAENQVPVSSSDMSPTSSDAVIDPTSSSAAVVDPSTLPAEGPITMPEGLGTLVDDFEDGDNLSKIGDYWYTYNDNDNGGASIITTPLNEEENIIPGRVNNGSNYALQVNYTLDRGDYEYDPYVGWGVQVAPDEANGHFGGLTYWYKGGAHEVHVEINLKEMAAKFKNQKVTNAEFTRAASDAKLTSGLQKAVKNYQKEHKWTAKQVYDKILQEFRSMDNFDSVSDDAKRKYASTISGYAG